MAALCLLLGTAGPAEALTMPLLDWSLLSWSDGQLSNTYFNVMLDDGSFVDIAVSIAFNTNNGNAPVWDELTPNIAGCGTVTPAMLDGPGRSTDRFGTLTDLAVVYDPDPGENPSNIEITLEFFQPGTSTPRPLSALEFEISDVDFSGPGDDCTNVISPPNGLEIEGFRQDQVQIISDNGNPVLSPKTPGSQTFVVLGNLARAQLNRVSTPGSDAGTVLVAFGALQPVSLVMITYSEFGFGGPCASSDPWCVGGQNNNPGFRGIALFGSSSVPVELVSFTIE